MTKGKTPELSTTEKMLLRLLLEKRQNFEAMWSEQAAKFQQEIEQRLGLEAGAIGTRFQLHEDGRLEEAGEETRKEVSADN